MKQRFVISTLAFTLGAATQLGATDCGQITRDSGFDLWCGDSLCTWKIVRGDAKRVATWHEGDSGVELVGDDAAIAQLTPVNSFDTRCIRFDLIADVEDTAEAFLDTDVEGDGRVDQHDRIPTSHFEPLSFLVAVKAPFDGIRFEINKRGPGRVVLAQIDAKTTQDTDCNGLTAIDSGPRPNGAGCGSGADCESGLCTLPGFEAPTNLLGAVCAGCAEGDAATSCGTGKVCGYHDPNQSIFVGYAACVATASRELGEQCLVDGECASNICNQHTCSACATSATCGGLACGPSWVSGFRVGPFVCGAGQGAGAPGAPCGSAGDCASGACTGTLRSECDDGRPCHDAAVSCPVESGLQPGMCTSVGYQGGSCQ